MSCCLRLYRTARITTMFVKHHRIGSLSMAGVTISCVSSTSIKNETMWLPSELALVRPHLKYKVSFGKANVDYQGKVIGEEEIEALDI